MKSRFERFSRAWWEWMTIPEPNSGCLLWLGCVCKSGYGRLAPSGRGSPVLAHRAAYACAVGPIEGQRHVCHRCDTPSCVNPDHLFIGTHEDNMRDMFAKGRARPSGSGTSRLAIARTALAAPLATRKLASNNTHSNVEMVECIHHIRTIPVLARWRQVTGVPAWRQDHDGPTCEVPQYQADNRVCELPPVATVALSCAALFPTPQARTRALAVALGWPS